MRLTGCATAVRPVFHCEEVRTVWVLIELLHIIAVVSFLGHEIMDPVDASTDSKAAYDLCHRFTSAQNSRHIDFQNA